MRTPDAAAAIQAVLRRCLVAYLVCLIFAIWRAKHATHLYMGTPTHARTRHVEDGRLRTTRTREGDTHCKYCNVPWSRKLVLKARSTRPAGERRSKGAGKGGKGAGRPKGAAPEPLAPGRSPIPLAAGLQGPARGGVRSGRQQLLHAHSLGKGGGGTPQPVRQPPGAQAPTDLKLQRLLDTVAATEKLGNIDGEYKDLHQKALERLNAYQMELENQKTPVEKANELQKRLTAQRSTYCLALEALTAAHNAYEEAQANLQRAEAQAAQAAEEVVDLETEYTQLEALAFPQAVPPGKQVVHTPRAQQALAVLEEEFGAHLSRDQSVWATMAEMGSQVDKLTAHIQAKIETARTPNAEAAGATTDGAASQDSPPGPGHHRVIPEDAPWVISTGTKAHAHLISGSSVSTQRYALEYFQKKQNKGKGKGKGKGKNPDRTEFPTPEEARDALQARGHSSQAQASGTPARAIPQPLAGLRPGAGGDDPPAEPEQVGIDVDKLTGHRRKRDSEEKEEAEGVGDRGTPTAGGFPGGDGSGAPVIPPAPAS